MADIRRIYATKQLTIPTGSSLSSQPVLMQRVVDGILEMPSAWTAADIGFKVSSASVASDAQLLYDNTASLVEITSPSVGVAFKFPTEVYAAHYMWLFSESGGAAVDQSASRVINIQLKS